MKYIRQYLSVLILLFLCLLSACGDIELPTNSGSKKDTETTESVDTAGYLTVAQLQNAEAGDYVTLRCYIVGYAKGSSSSGFNFGLPTESEVRSNIVVADTLVIDDDTALAACQLKANSAEREELNLVDNPDLLGQHIYLQGTVKKYFGLMGLYPVDGYEFIDDEDTTDDPQPTPSTPSLSIPINTEDDAIVFEGA